LEPMSIDINQNMKRVVWCIFYYSDSKIHCSVENVLCVNYVHPLGWLNLLLDAFMKIAYFEEARCESTASSGYL